MMLNACVRCRAHISGGCQADSQTKKVQMMQKMQAVYLLPLLIAVHLVIQVRVQPQRSPTSDSVTASIDVVPKNTVAKFLSRFNDFAVAFRRAGRPETHLILSLPVMRHVSM
jgi:hypothetical protein